MQAPPVALITGAASGIGRALASALAARGHRVVLTDINPAVAGVAAELGGEGHVLDVRDRERFLALVEQIESTLGPIEVLVNNAGLVRMGEARTLGAADWEDTLRVNLHGPIHGILAVYPKMCARGRGQIVQVASALGLAPATGCAPYVTSKHALVGLSAALRAEAAAYGVSVVVACPGFVDTPLLTELVPTELVPTERAPVASAITTAGPRKLPEGTLTPEGCAQAILRGMDRNTAVITMGWQTRVYWWFYRLFPDALIRELGKQFRAKREKSG